jgi:arginyl-tRNA synthetase
MGSMGGSVMRARTFVEAALQQAVHDLGWTWPEKASIEAPKRAEHGDLATNVAMVLPKEAGSTPRARAQALQERLLAVCADNLAAVDVAGPGFLNLTLSPAFWQGTVVRVLQDAQFGASSLGQGKKAQVEYVSANPTGPLHIGHGRGAAVGDALARILRFAGYAVHTEYYLNDAGRQMRLLGLSVWVRYQQLCGRQIPFPEDGYQGDYIGDIAARIRQERGDALLTWSEEDAREFCYQEGMNEILAGIRQDLEVFRAEHQVWFSEKSLVDSGVVEATLADLQAKGLAYEKDGALWFASSRFGDDKDRVLRKSDGSLTYFASDIAYHAHKIGRGFDLMIDVWGADHHGYVPRMKAAVAALGRDPECLQVILVQLVNLLRDGQQIAMSTRAGTFETLADVCAEVGVDAARFLFLSRKSDAHLDFDLEVVKRQSMDNPVFYVQYAHARICSLQRKAREMGIALPEVADPALLGLLATAEDMALLKTLDAFGDAVELSARTLSPHHISYYLMDLAGQLHRYYAEHPVLSGEDAGLRNARLLLMEAVRRVLARGLDLLGVDAPLRM